MSSAAPDKSVSGSAAGKTRLLVIDDDRKLCRLIKVYLEPMGYAVESAHTGPDGLEKALAGDWQAVILDVMLPGKSPRAPRARPTGAESRRCAAPRSTSPAEGDPAHRTGHNWFPVRHPRGSGPRQGQVPSPAPTAARSRWRRPAPPLAASRDPMAPCPRSGRRLPARHLPTPPLLTLRISSDCACCPIPHHCGVMDERESPCRQMSALQCDLEAASQGGKTPSAISNSRTAMASGRFRRNVSTVARPVGVRPSSLTPFHAKCAGHDCRRGSKRRTTVPVAGSTPHRLGRLYRLQ